LRAWLGIALEGFPEFEQFCTDGFPPGTQSSKSVASTSFATPAKATAYSLTAVARQLPPVPQGFRGFADTARHARLQSLQNKTPGRSSGRAYLEVRG